MFIYRAKDNSRRSRFKKSENKQIESKAILQDISINTKLAYQVGLIRNNSLNNFKENKLKQARLIGHSETSRVEKQEILACSNPVKLKSENSWNLGKDELSRLLVNRIRCEVYSLNKNGSGSLVRIRNRCVTTQRARAVLSNFKLSRLKFRELASNTRINGISRASW